MWARRVNHALNAMPLWTLVDSERTSRMQDLLTRVENLNLGTLPVFNEAEVDLYVERG